MQMEHLMLTFIVALLIEIKTKCILKHFRKFTDLHANLLI